MTPSQLEEMERKAADVPPMFRALFIRAMTGNSRKDAMEYQCAECMGFSTDPCTSRATCPAYKHRRVHRT